MRSGRKQFGGLVVAAPALLVLLTAVAAAHGQGRGGLNLSSPGTLGNPNFGSSTFRSYSYGLGGLSGPSGAGGGVMSQSLGGDRVFDIDRGGSSLPSVGGAAGSVAIGKSSSRVLYRPDQIRINSEMGGSSVQGFQEMAENRVLLGQHVAGVFGVSETPLAAGRTLTSLAPDNRGQFATLIRTAESSMKIRQYGKAAEEFLQANIISSKAPETLIGAANASFGRGGYAVMSHYLSLAIKYFPELPLVDLKLREFYRSPEEFIALRTLLVEKTEAWPNDGQLWLCLAYVQWFDGSPASAADALREGIRVSRDPHVTEAIEQFWDGCVASGKVSGRLTTRGVRPPMVILADVASSEGTSDTADASVDPGAVEKALPAGR